ncbi:MAG: hypothetical protein JXR91_06100 [Deltaproteobacteria bacterium]|nr:hypothetical protein [Deltaproteobacteria bacterium]
MQNKASGSAKSRSVKQKKNEFVKTVLDNEIAMNAYLTWQQYGGDPMKNWLDAEKKITHSMLKKTVK